ncbi:MAG: bifunctional 4-hydroxy-3-methylbut-2-enyl diphosphate reductase/30S ribosomal protein S1 [Firmicutes bacterium]|nr:bifunctional 4-hydroxy-3-methylbut-2-enyl diphosphate reductase/30S ribosomal protein S1 [Bacillota bacterium]
MIEIIRAQAAGFCSGVKRVLRMAEETLSGVDEEVKVYSLGPLVHNQAVINRFADKGVQVIDSLDDIPEGSGAVRLIIRSHGVGPEVLQEAERRGIEIVDGTCPLVKRVQMIADQLRREGYPIVVLGEREHPEVVGIMAWAGENATAVIDEQEAERLNGFSRLGLVSQTTQTLEKYEKVGSILLKQAEELRTFNTVCKATRVRQSAACDLAGQVDLMVVVGSRMSANTKQLTRVCSATGTDTHMVEDASEVDASWLKGVSRVGVTAGASTPEWIIEEVVSRMSEMERERENVLMEPVIGEQAEVTAPEENQAVSEELVNQDTMEAQLTRDMPDLRQGNIIKGKVVQVKDDEVLVDVGGKSEGVIPLRELSIRNISSAKELVKTGDEIEVAVVRSENDEGTMILSKRRADQMRAWDGLEEAYNNKTELKGEVVQVVKGGLLVDVGARGFVPASLIERGYVSNLDKYPGTVLRLRVIDLDRGKNKIVLSQKAILEEEYNGARKELWESIEPDQRRRGVVRRLTSFGAFVDIGGADGLLHISEMSWKHIGHPSEVVQEGDEVEVYVLAVDKERQRISLGLKQIVPSPWDLAAEKYGIGQIVNGRVVRTVPFGAFVQIEPGVEGLVHISQLAPYRVAKVEDVVKVEDEIPVKIIDFKPQEQRMSLSLSAAREEMEQEAQQEIYTEYKDQQKFDGSEEG